MDYEEIIFRPTVGTDIRIAAKQALEKIDIGKKVVLAFNGAYIPVNGKTVGEIDSEYDAWIEKQGEQTHAELNQSEVTKTSDQELEPKFNVGDWVVYDHRPYQVVELPKEGYINLGLRRNGKVEFAPSPYCRHWAIQDAKNGDVLANDHHILILKELDYDWYSNGFPYSVHAYCGIKPNGNFEIGKDNWCFCGTLHMHPATKEQRDLLFEKMKEDGYEWDGEKKELKKIKPKKLDPDKVIEWLNDQACQGWIEDVEVDKFIDKFKQDFEI